MYRTHTCWELTAAAAWETVTLAWWVAHVRDMWGLFFLDLRDRYGVTQVQFDPSDHDTDLVERLEKLKHERVVQVEGTVVARPDGQTNPEMKTGEIEVVLTDLKVLTNSKIVPFAIEDDPATSEEQRFKYRYLDLRRRPVLKNIEFRAQMNHFTRNWFAEQWFLEVQTPIFTVSSPEGARDYLVPSRINPGKFYALPQSPQQYKQLLMVGGIDKYFQIAPCFRDEDPRADRAMCEFYQVDLEMSFVEQEDVLKLLKEYSLGAVNELVPHKKVITDFPHISHHDAMNRFGTDRPDIRFGMELKDLSELFADSGFGVFKNAIKEWWVVKAIKLEGEVMSRKEIDELTEVAKQAWAGGLAYFIFEENEVRSPIAKFFSDEELAWVAELMEATPGDMVFFGAGEWHLVCKVLDKIRRTLRDKYELVDQDELAFCFVVDFPFYEYNHTTDAWDFGHNPFSYVVGGKEALENKPIGEIMTNQYDVVLNWFEIGGGSIRNHDPEVMIKAFEKIGYDESDIKEQFGAMYEAFQYGCPPHGGCAFGFDRFLMILADESNIRETYAFPKSGKAEDVMMGAPAGISKEQLEELHVRLDVTEEEK